MYCKIVNDVWNRPMMYGIDIEEELAEIIPLLNDDDGKKYRLDKRSYKLLDQ